MNTCKNCGEELFGRVDKKFCGDQCRNTFNNKQNSNQNNLVRNVNNILRKNRRILEQLVEKEHKASKKDKLLQLGFNFNYFTNTYTTKGDRVYYYCYDYGYSPSNDNWITLVKKKEYI